MNLPASLEPDFKDLIYPGAMFERDFNFGISPTPNLKKCIVLANEQNQLVIVCFATSQPPRGRFYRNNDIHVPIGRCRNLPLESWIGLDKVLPLDIQVLEDEYNNDILEFTYDLEYELHEEIADNVKGNPRIKGKHKKLIAKAFESRSK